jgi:hypothetical protein
VVAIEPVHLLLSLLKRLFFVPRFVELECATTMGLCAFQDSWLSNPDFKGWLQAVASDKRSAHCSLCQKTFSIANSGVTQVMSHSKGTKHKDKVKAEADNMRATPLTEFYAAKPSTTTSSASSSGAPKAKSQLSLIESRQLANAVAKAEILSTLNAVNNHHSFRSQEANNSLYREMFPDSSIAAEYSCAETKARYMTVYGLGPYFLSELKKSVRGKKFVLLFDESLNKKNQEKQLDLFIRFWDSTENCVVTRFWDSKFMGHASAVDLMKSIMPSMSSLLTQDLIQLSMDGPNVNWKLYENLETRLSHDHHKKLINTGNFQFAHVD